MLDIDPENAHAYLGKALAQAKCTDLDAFTAARLASTRSATGEQFTLEPDSAHIHSMVEKLVIEGYLPQSAIENAYDFDLHYTSYVSARRKQLEREKENWQNNKFLQRAEQFADPALRESLIGAKRRLREELEQRIADARTQEQEAADDLRRRMAYSWGKRTGKWSRLTGRA